MFWGAGSAGYEGPVYMPNVWDTLFIRGIQIPGKVEVRALPEQQVDVQKAPARDGATATWQGYMPGPIDIEVLLWTRPQYEAWQEVIAQLWPRPGKIAPGTKFDDKTSTSTAKVAAQLAERNAFEIKHPALVDLRISRVIIKGISLPVPGPIPQSRVVNIKAIEFCPTTGQPPARAKGVDKKPPDPVDQFQDDLAVNSDKQKGPGAGGTGGGPTGETPRGKQGTAG